MYANFKGKTVEIFTNSKILLRRFRVSNDIVNIQISGEGNNAIVAVTMKNGKTLLYKATGQLIRQ